jgi:hypothetical protein
MNRQPQSIATKFPVPYQRNETGFRNSSVQREQVAFCSSEILTTDR